MAFCIQFLLLKNLDEVNKEGCICLNGTLDSKPGRSKVRRIHVKIENKAYWDLTFYT